MTIEEFDLLINTDKEEVVWKHGIFLNNYEEGNDICDAYELFNFFVSFCYKLDRHESAEITAKSLPDELPHLFTLSNLLK